MAHDVFISYSSKDKPVADALCATLEGKGVRCWIAPRDVLPGMDWGEAIVDAIAGSRIMVLIFSANANASPQIRREVERAVHRDVAIVPFQIDHSEPNKSLEYFISTPHWLDAMGGKMEEHLDRLAATVQTLLTRRPPAEPGRDVAVAAASVERDKPSAAAPAPPAVTAPAVVVSADPVPYAAAPRVPAERASPVRWVVAGVVAMSVAGALALWVATRSRPAVPQAAGPSATSPTTSPQGTTPAQPPPSPVATTKPAAMQAARAALVSGAGLPTEVGQPRVYTGLAKPAHRVSFSADGRYLLATQVGGQSHLWDLATGNEARTFNGGPAVFSPGGRRIAVVVPESGKASSLVVYDTETGRVDYQMEQGVASTGQGVVAFSPDDSQIAAPDYKRGLWVAQFPHTKARRLEPLGPGAVRQVAFTADGRSLVIGEDSGEGEPRHIVSCRDAATGEVRWRAVGGNRFAVSTAGDVFTGDTLRAGRTGAVIASIPMPPDGSLTGADFTPDGSLLLYTISGSNKEVTGLHGWDVIAKRPRPPLISGKSNAVAISPDGRRAVTANVGSLLLFDVKEWKQIAELSQKPGGQLFAVAFSPDGRYVAASGDDLTVSVWRLPD